MSKLRKLQSEIDQTLKRVNEGVSDWDALWDKLEETEDPSQRDKIVNEMKRELKKLQRLREQVRGWAASGEVKDDTRLTDARKAVEREMERFKGLERELKIKQFSSEGLMRDSTDPVMVAKVQCADWINEAVTQLETQVEQFEADLEALGPVKAGKGRPPRVVELEGFMRRHQEHVTKLEQVLRLLENDQVTPEEVEGALRDGIDYYLASSTEADFVADESMYDSLPLKEVDDSIGKITAHTPRAQARGRDAFDEGSDAAQEGGKGKRAKGSKAGGKSKASEGGSTKGAAAAASSKPAIPPPPGLPPPPTSPATATTPAAATRSTSFKTVVAASSLKPPTAGTAAAAGAATAAATAAIAAATAAGLPAHHVEGGPETPSPPAQAGAASTPPVPPQRSRLAAAAGRASPPTAEEAAELTAGLAGAPAAAPSSPSDAAVFAAGPAEAPPPAPPPPPPQQQGPPSAGEQQAQPLSPTSAARLGVFNEQMLLAAAAHAAEQQARLQQAQQAQQEGGPTAFGAPPALSVLEVPPGLPPVALTSPSAAAAAAGSGAAVPAAGGHSPLAALATAVSAAAAAAGSGSPFSPAQHRQLSADSLPMPAQQHNHLMLPREGSAAHAAPPGAQGDLSSPRSMHSTASVAGSLPEENGWRSAAAAAEIAAHAAAAHAHAAAAHAAAAAAGTPRAGHDQAGGGGQLAGGSTRLGIPTVLSFNHLQSQAESVLGLAGDLGANNHEGVGGAGSEQAGTPTGGGGGEAEGGAGAVGYRPHLPWSPNLLDVRLLETSVQNRPMPGDGDWQLQDGGTSGAGTPVPAQNQVLTPASYPNQVHPSLRREETFKKLSAETCFFSFYFQQGTRQQLFASNALKTQGWRFHTQFNAWFARQSQPRVVTETHEQGPLIYFDSLLHNVTPPTAGLLPQQQQQAVYSGWCPRVSRPDFLFEYKFMEQEDTQAPSDP